MYLLNLEIVVLLFDRAQADANVFPGIIEKIALGLAHDRALGFVGAGVTHQGVAVADVEIDVG